MPPSKARTIGVRALAVAATAALSMSLLAAPTASAAEPASPKSLSERHTGSGAPVFSWGAVPGATDYEFQVDTEDDFGSPDVKMTTKNTRVVPTTQLKQGENFWRVRAVAGREQSSWSAAQSFRVNAVSVPAPLQPPSGSVLQMPDNAPLLRWTATPKAESYTVEVDGDADFVGAKAYSTKSTSFVIPDALEAGDWFWRVSAQIAPGVRSHNSTVSTFIVSPLRTPNLVGPSNTHSEQVLDVVLDWEPVLGASTYDVQVSTQRDFQAPQVSATKVRGTRYSPAITINNDEFWWRVRAIDADGQQTPWQENQYSFTRAWNDRPQPLFPLGTAGSPGVQTEDSVYFSWTSVRNASNYQLQVSTDQNFSPTLTVLCETPHTTWTPHDQRFDENYCALPEGETGYWRVRPMDRPYNTRAGLPGTQWSAPQVFRAAALPRQTESISNTSGWRASGLKVAVDGVGAHDGSKGCISTPSTNNGGAYTAPSVCQMSTTPVLSWDKDPRAEYYIVYWGQDSSFTTADVDPFVTSNTMVAMGEFQTRKPRSGWKFELGDSSSGRPYFWTVVPCTDDNRCGLDPTSSGGAPGAASFAKFSPAPTGLQVLSTANDITFAWDDYNATNRGTVVNNEAGIQSARQYRIEVDDEPTFSRPLLDSADVDQTTFTSASDLYPEGRIYWRVTPIGPQENLLTPAVGSDFVKSSPAVSLRTPLGGAVVPGTTALEWDVQAFALTYTVEVYANGDTTFSPANKVVGVTTRTPAYAPAIPLPASSLPYVWRVRKNDPDGNAGSWSSPGTFRSSGVAPELVSPGNNAQVSGTGVMLEWSDVPGVSRYEVRLRQGGRTTTVSTVANAYAPSALADGSWQWQVAALDTGGKTLGVSPERSFRIDGTAPKVSKVAVKGKKKKQKIVVTFSEAVKGVKKGTFVATQPKGKATKGKKAKVKKFKVKKATLAKNGTSATLVFKKPLKKGSYTLQWKGSIKDKGGNALPKGTTRLTVR